jgi:hypothetical protein
VLQECPKGHSSAWEFGVCTAVNGIVPLTGRRTHLVLHSKYIVFTTSCRKAHWPHSLEPKTRKLAMEDGGSSHLTNQALPLKRRVHDFLTFFLDQWISGSVDQWWKVFPRRSRGQTRATRGVNNPPQRATGVSRALACVLNTRGCPQVFYTSPVIHPVRVHKYPWQAS